MKKIALLFLVVIATSWQVTAIADAKPRSCQAFLSQDLCHKIGQMLVVGFGGMAVDENDKVLFRDKNGLTFSKKSSIAKAIKKHHVGGVILFSIPFVSDKTGKILGYRNIKNPKQLKKLTSELRDYADYPLWITVDQEGGLVTRLNRENGFVIPRFIPESLGVSNNLTQTFTLATEMAKVLNRYHFNVNFSPVVDVNINPENPIIGLLGRSFSNNPKVVSDQAAQFIKAFKNYNIIPTLKHFPGHGSSDKDSHIVMVDVTKTYQPEIELEPFKKLIAAGFDGMIMTAHTINGQMDKTQCKPGNANDSKTWCPSTLSYKTLTELLRQKLNFKGVIISDDMEMSAIAKEYTLKESLEKGINAGVNVFIIANHKEDSTEKVINTIARLIHNGKIDKARIEESNRYIKRLRASIG